MTFRPFLLILCASAFGGCATGASAKQKDAESAAVHAELRMLRESNTRLENRLRRLEAQSIVTSAPSSSYSAPAGRAETRPDLAVVKMRPRKDAAPKLRTTVAVTEPSADAIDMVSAPVLLTNGNEVDDAVSTIDPAMADAQYEEGLRALKTGNIDGGVRKLQTFAEENPRHSNADNALYFGGLGRMGLNDFKGAAELFEATTTRYPAGDAVVDAMLKLAECHARLNKRDDARALYTRIVLNYPGTAAATQAEQRLVALSR